MNGLKNACEMTERSTPFDQQSEPYIRMLKEMNAEAKVLPK
ncbi:hypothetical protein [Paenibacillus apiarius]